MGWSRLDLGVGVIALGSLDRLWPGIEDLVDVVEVEPQTLWESRLGGGAVISPAALAWLLGCGRPLLAHGVGFPVGGTTAPDPGGVAASAASARALDAVQWSEHLAYNTADGAYAGFLLPPFQTPAAVAAAIGHITAYQKLYDRPFLVETPTSYLRPVPGDLDDGDYLAAVAEGADCGILLDLHNVWTNERNGRQPVAELLETIPLDRVWEMHLAGGYATDGYYLDAHVGPVDLELLELAADVVPRLPNLRAVVYEAVPASLEAQGVDGLRQVLGALHAVAELPAVDDGPAARTFSGAGRVVPAPTAVDGRIRSSGVDLAATARREAELLAFTTRASDELASADPGATLIRGLTDQGRLSLLVRRHEATLGALLTALGKEGTEALLLEFLAATPASAWREDQGRAFADWLGCRPDVTASLTPRDAAPTG